MNLEDIARKAGVSRSTVSRVINDEPNVNAGTRELIWNIIRKENFQPNPSARALVRRQTQIIGVVIPTSENIFYTDNNYWMQLLAGISQVTRQRNYAMLLWLGSMTGDDEHSLPKVANNRLMDGIIIASLMHSHPLFKRLLSLPYPFVMIDRPLEHADKINYVSVDNVAAADVATTHLIALSRRRIAHISGDMQIADAHDRLLGYKNALRRAGLPIDDNLIAEGYFTQQAGYDATRRLLPFQPDAIFAGSDTVALGALRAVREAGLEVPRDIALVGFDDVDVATHVDPPLTSMRQPLIAKGAAAAELLLDLIQNKVQMPQQILMETELVVRESTVPEPLVAA